MKIKTILLLAVALAISICLSAQSGEQAKPVSAKANATAKDKAQADYEAAVQAAKAAEAAVAPLRDALQKADAAYANARKIANAKRQQATETKRLASEAGAKELKEAEAAAPAAVKALADAASAKPAAEKALAEAQAAKLPLQQAYDAAEKAAREAETAAKVAADAVNKLEDEAAMAAAKAAVKRREAKEAKAVVAQMQQEEQQAKSSAHNTAQKLAEAEKRKKSADAALQKAKSNVAAATAAVAAAEKAIQEAAAKAQHISADAAKSDAEKKQTAAKVATQRKAVDAAKTALQQAQAAAQSVQKQVDAAAQSLTQATQQQKAADAALTKAKKQVAAATMAAKATEKLAKKLTKAAEAKQQTAAPVIAARKAIAGAAAVLTQAQLAKQQAQDQTQAAAKTLNETTAQKKKADAALADAKSRVNAATAAVAAADKVAQDATAKAKQISTDAAKPEAEKKQAAANADAKCKAVAAAKTALTQAQKAEQTAQAQAATAAQKQAGAEKWKKATEASVADAAKKVVAARAAKQAAYEAAGELGRLDAASQQAAANAAEKQKAAQAARAAFMPAQQKLEKAVLEVNAATQKLTQAEARKKSTAEYLENLKKRIAAAKQTQAADEQAAAAAEAVATPLKEQADKARTAFTAAVTIVDEKRALVEQAKAVWYRLAAAKQAPSLLESPEPPKPTNRIDEIVFAKLQTLGIKPALCSDAVFIRRAYLDVTGKLPSAEDAKAFIQSTDKDKRAALIDRLLDQTAHVDYWAMKWCDILRVKAEFPVKVWPNAAQAYHRWIWESVAKNKPYDQFARKLLTSSGSNFRVGPVNFYRAIQDRTPEGIAAAVGLALLGTRTHLWPAERRTGMAAFFSQVGYKPTSEWKEEIVFWDPLKSAAVPGSTAPGLDAVAKAVTVTNEIPQALPKPLSENSALTAVFPDGVKTTVPPDRDPREAFAEWLIQPKNPWFARAAVNRTWAWIMGRGIVHEPDDIRDDNPPSNPELLAYLQQELISSGYNLKHLRRLILTSTTYQLSSIPKGKGEEGAANFASYPMRRVEAEVLIDALNGITGSSDLYTSAVPEPFTYIPQDMSAVELADGSITSPFLTLFGRSARATGMGSERVNELASSQWLFMLNSGQIQSKLLNGAKLRALIAAGGQPREIAERLYLTILSRFPTEADVKAAEGYAKAGVTKGRDVWIDLAWALINSPEFLMRH